MKKTKKRFIIYVIIYFIFSPSFVSAAEVTGRISTVPEPRKMASPSRGEPQKEDLLPHGEQKENFSVFHGDGMLLRGPGMRIYVIENNRKRHIVNLSELGKYFRGQPVYDVKKEDLDRYEEIRIEREYFDGELIRGIGDVRVYVIEKGKKRHVLSIEELRAYYCGREIFNVERKILGKY